MRKINIPSITCFSVLFIPTTMASFIGTFKSLEFIPILQSELLLKIILSIPSVYLSNIIVYRIFLYFRPLKNGDYSKGSPNEFTYNVYVLYYLILFNSLLPTFLIPVPLMRSIYNLLGAKLGHNTYTSGIIFDPPMVEVGENTLLGYNSIICPHVIESEKISFESIKIGNRVTIGMRSTIMAGCTIGDDSIVAAGSLVLKGTQIGTGEIWAGSPAKKIRDSKSSHLPIVSA